MIARSDLLSTFFLVAAVVLYLKPQLSRFGQGMMALSIVLGMLAKPTVAMLAPILFYLSILEHLKDHKNKNRKQHHADLIAFLKLVQNRKTWESFSW